MGDKLSAELSELDPDRAKALKRRLIKRTEWAMKFTAALRLPADQRGYQALALLFECSRLSREKASYRSSGRL